MITIALAGNPNSGKTTLFNALTGSNQYVGNWPGVTVERKEARFELEGEEATLVDLPGVYSLSPYSIEENITRHFIAQHSPDVVLNIVDATNLERNLYLTFQLLELSRPVVVALNLMDEVRKNGGGVDCAALAKFLGAPVVPISAKRRTGFDEMFTAIYQQAKTPAIPRPVERYDANTRLAVSEIVAALGGDDSHSAFDEKEHYEHRDESHRDDDHAATDAHMHIGGYYDEGDEDHAPPTDWVAMKLLEGDEMIRENAYLTDEQRTRIRSAIAKYIERGRETYPNIDGMTLVSTARYAAIDEAMRRAQYRRRATQKDDLTERLDRVFVNKYLAFPIFLVLMGVMFYLTFGPVGTFLSDGVEWLVGLLGQAAEAGLNAIHSPGWVVALVRDGVFAGVGGVVVFLPQILLIFLFLSILEDSGYMARAAFLTDRLLGRLGLSGRSFIPMLMGFGCTTTAVIGARGVENERDRRMTILLTPFMSCGAKLPVYGLFAAAFFARYQGLVVFSLYLLGMLIMVACGLILRRTVFKTGQTPFVMEMPPYRFPTPRNVLRRLWIRAKDFLTRAGTVIFAMSVLIWFLQSFSFDFRMVEDSADSIFAALGKLLAPLFVPLGFGEWQKVMSLLSGLVAKEAVVSSMQVLYSAADSAALSTALAGQFTPLAAYAFLVFTLLYPPCVSAIASMRRELGSRKYLGMSLGIQFGTAYLAALLVYQIGRLFL